MSTIVTRAGKGSPLTHNEVDANFTNLNTDKAEVGSANTFTAAQTMSSQLNLTNASDYNLYASGAGANYMAGSLGIGAVPVAGTNLYISKNITGGVQSYGTFSTGAVQSDVTTAAINYLSVFSTQATTFTLANARHYDCSPITIGAGSTVTTQVGFYSRALTGATNNYSFQGVTAAATGRYNLYMSGTADNYLAGNLGVAGLPSTGINLRIAGNSTGITTVYGIQQSQSIQSDVTVASYLNHTVASTQAASFTLSALYHYSAAQGTIGATSAVTSQYGYIANSSLTGATNNYGFYGNIAAATGRYNLYMSGTANNYLAGQLLVGTTVATNGYVALSPTQSTNTYQVSIAGTNTNASASIGGVTISPTFTGTTSTANTFGLVLQPVATVATGATFSQYVGAYINPLLNNSTIPSSMLGVSASPQLFSGALGGTITLVSVFNAQGGINAAATTNVTSWFNYYSVAISNGAAQTITNVYGFYGNQAAATGRWNFYAAGTADNYLAGSLGIGSTALTGYNVRIGANITGATTAAGLFLNQTGQSDVTSSVRGVQVNLSTQATTYTTAQLIQFIAAQGSIGAGSTATSQFGFFADSSLTGATNNYSFYGNIAAATGRYNLYMAGTAANYFNGDMQFNKTVTAAGTTGAQTISKNAGTVNFAAAATSLVVTNTLVTANSIIICTVGTNDTTMKSVSAVAAAGSFTIYSNAAATAETRVNFIVIN